jgi:hypothetical protein
MLVPLHCFTCHCEETHRIDLNDTGTYEGTCVNGHALKAIMPQFIFELLSEIGLNAIYDGYYREAVSSFASCLERFYEFYIKLICTKNAINAKNMETTWKKVNNQSERQLGAFMFIYLVETGQEVPVLDQEMISFRNKIIHKGEIPDKAKTIGFAQSVLDVINKILIPLKMSEKALLLKESHTRQKMLHEKLKDCNCVISYQTLVALNRDIAADDDIITALDKIKPKREWNHSRYGG